MTRYSPADLRAQGKTIITAHSACEDTAPNSREHILAAIASGAEMIEVDVRMADELLYLYHDVPEDFRTCVTLRELFTLVGPAVNLHMNLDLKTDGLVEPVMALASEFGLNSRIVFTGAANGDRLLANRLGGEVWRSMWDGDSVPDGIAANHKDGSPFLNVHFPMITPEYDRELRAIGGAFSAWTVDREEDLRHFLEMGVGNITTRRPVLALKLRREIQHV